MFKIKADDGTWRGMQLGVLVLLAHVGPPADPALECRHLDDDSSNNSPANLAWGTHAENMADSVHNGSHKGINAGEANGRSVLTREIARRIRSEHVPAPIGRPKPGAVVPAPGSPAWLAARYGVSLTTVRELIYGRRWS